MSADFCSAAVGRSDLESLDADSCGLAGKSTSSTHSFTKVCCARQYLHLYRDYVPVLQLQPYNIGWSKLGLYFILSVYLALM